MRLSVVRLADMRTIDWVDGAIEIIDQTALPGELRILRLHTVPELVAAIQSLAVRGAPALGWPAPSGWRWLPGCTPTTRPRWPPR